MLTILMFAAVAQAVDGDPAAEGSSSSVSAEALRQRIHDMRMNLLIGGDRVRQAEGEAVAFYRGKVDAVESRIDSVAIDLTEKRASYDLALERTLGGPDPTTRTVAMSRAASLRTEIASLEGETAKLDARRSHLLELISAVDDRDEERERLVTQIETGPELDPGFAFAVGTVGLAPAALPVESTSPLDDDELVRDLLERDPVGARRILFETDPRGYWERFPLRPPTSALRRAFDFPPPDLPGRR